MSAAAIDENGVESIAVGSYGARGINFGVERHHNHPEGPRDMLWIEDDSVDVVDAVALAHAILAAAGDLGRSA